MNNSRTYKSLKNTIIALVAQIFSVVLSFITRTIFIHSLGVGYLGLNGLFSNILSMLSLAEMGIGTAIVYEMYKPLATNDEPKTAAFMNLYRSLYKYIGFFIAVVGASLIPFLDIFISDSPDISNIEYIYILFLTNAVLSYFFTYQRSIIIADQKAYISNINTIIFLVIQNIFQILSLILFNNYYLYLIIQIVCTVLSNVEISIRANKLFPYLKKYKREKITRAEQIGLFKNVIGMMSAKIGAIVVNGTDNLLISAFVGLTSVGLYSNYTLIVNTVKTLFVQSISAITASVGNLTATENSDKAYLVFRRINFITYAISFFSSTFLFVLLNPFIKLWIGNSYILNQSIVLMIVINFYIVQMRQPSQMFINTYGLFWHIKWKSLIEALINLIVSLLLVSTFKMGILGVLLGTIVSNITTNVWWEPYVAFKFGLSEKLRKYFKTYFLYILICILNMILCYKVSMFTNYSDLIDLSIDTLLCVLISACFFVLIFYRNSEYCYYKDLAKRILNKKIKS